MRVLRALAAAAALSIAAAAPAEAQQTNSVRRPAAERPETFSGNETRQ